jgi:putative FmdB family regulatory protein
MPIYEYRCAACGHQFEAWQKMSDAPVSECPECSAADVEKLISATSFQLKGSGWYVTDYGRKDAGGGGKKKKGSTGEGSSGAGSDSGSSTPSGGAAPGGSKDAQSVAA